MDIKFIDLDKYLIENNCFGLTASIRKKVIIYKFRRYFTKIELSLKIKVDKETKKVISVLCNGKEYTDLDEIKAIVSNDGNYHTK